MYTNTTLCHVTINDTWTNLPISDSPSSNSLATNNAHKLAIKLYSIYTLTLSEKCLSWKLFEFKDCTLYPLHSSAFSVLSPFHTGTSALFATCKTYHFFFQCYCRFAEHTYPPFTSMYNPVGEYAWFSLPLCYMHVSLALFYGNDTFYKLVVFGYVLEVTLHALLTILSQCQCIQKNCCRQV